MEELEKKLKASDVKVKAFTSKLEVAEAEAMAINKIIP
jgi:hypothetical protein